MKILSATQLRTIDQRSGDTLQLMENAGTRVVEVIEERFENIPELKVSILCGKGNNGGDGFVIARLLKERGCDPQVFLFAREQDIAGDAAVNLERLKDLGDDPTVVKEEAQWIEFGGDEETDLVIDALL